MDNTKLALIIVCSIVVLFVVAVVAYIIGWNMGHDYGQQEMCDQLAQPWTWNECY